MDEAQQALVDLLNWTGPEVGMEEALQHVRALKQALVREIAVAQPLCEALLVVQSRPLHAALCREWVDVHLLRSLR